MDIERAKKALINADAAGDVAAAKELANFIKQSSQPKQAQKPSVGKTALSQGLQGATFGFSDEITDPFGVATMALMKEPKALITGEFTNPALVDQAVTARQQTQQDLRNQMSQRPEVAIPANIAGALLTGGAGASTKAGAALGGMLRSGGTGARVVKGAASGAALSGLYGAGASEEGQRLKGAGQAAILGGVVGGAIPAVGAVVKGAIPKIDEGLSDVVDIAQKYKIPVSLDQVTGSRALKTFQKTSQDLPFSGQQGFREKQMRAFNEALFNTVGIKADKFTPMNMDRAFFEVGQKFEKLGSGKTFNLNSMAPAIQEIADEAPMYATQDAIASFKSAVEKLQSNAQNGIISGEKLNTLRSQINKAARKASAMDTKELLRDLENVVVESMSAGDETLSVAKQQYKNLLVLEPLAAKQTGGNISPAQLANRVSKIYGRSFVRGQAGEIGDLARVGKELLPELGGSDTTQKMLYAGGALLGLGNTTTSIPFAAGLAANRATQSLVNRNQSLVRALSEAQKKQLLSLPPKEASKVLDALYFTANQQSGNISNGVK